MPKLLNECVRKKFTKYTIVQREGEQANMKLYIGQYLKPSRDQSINK